MSTWRIGRVAGITLRLHWSTLLVFAWVALAQGIGHGPLGAAEGLTFIVLLFVSIVAHELGHALAARWFGVRTVDITLLPIGGLARLERLPEGALEGFVVALAGPLVSAQLAVGLLGLAHLAGASLWPEDGRVALLVQLGWANAGLWLFNLLPAFPLDGGRALRSLLVPFVGSLEATRRAAAVGRILAVLIGSLVLFGSPMAVLVAAFIWIQGAAEERAAVLQDALAGRTVAEALSRDVRALSLGATVQEAADLLRHGLQQDFPVVDADGAVAGLVSQGDLVQALAAGRHQDPVWELVAPGVDVVTLSAPLAAVHERLLQAAAGGHRALPVVDGGRFVGLVGLDTISALLAITAAERRPRPTGRPTGAATSARPRAAALPAS